MSRDDISGQALECLLEAALSSEEGMGFSQEVLLALFTFLRSYAKLKVPIAMKLASSAIDREFLVLYRELTFQSSRIAVIWET